MTFEFPRIYLKASSYSFLAARDDGILKHLPPILTKILSPFESVFAYKSVAIFSGSAFLT